MLDTAPLTGYKEFEQKAQKIEQESKLEFQVANIVKNASNAEFGLTETGDIISLNAGNNDNIVFNLSERYIQLSNGDKLRFVQVPSIPRMSEVKQEGIANIVKELGRKLRQEKLSKFLTPELTNLLESNKQDVNKPLRKKLQSELGHFYKVDDLYKTSIYKEYIIAILKSELPSIISAIKKYSLLESKPIEPTITHNPEVEPNSYSSRDNNRIDRLKAVQEQIVEYATGWQEKFKLGDKIYKTNGSGAVQIYGGVDDGRFVRFATQVSDPTLNGTDRNYFSLGDSKNANPDSYQIIKEGETEYLRVTKVDGYPTKKEIYKRVPLEHPYEDWYCRNTYGVASFVVEIAKGESIRYMKTIANLNYTPGQYNTIPFECYSALQDLENSAAPTTKYVEEYISTVDVTAKNSDYGGNGEDGFLSPGYG